ncbi:MAG: Holliday junction resolvase RuvX [Proteobacteria bacterium]|nr:MAG: Holliday junction resolvase RuvX [Pseudomonadota bacterium]
MPSGASSKKIQQVIAFDFGEKRIGVACGQCITGGASALPPMKARDGIPDWQVIERTLADWQPDLVIVGLPLNMDGSESAMSQRARKFANRIHGRFGVPVAMHDERLTSFEAKGYVMDAGGSRDFGKNSVDGLAAVLLFESWFSEHEQTRRQQTQPQKG